MVRIARALTVATAALALSMSGLAAFPNEAHAANSGGEQLVYRLYNRVSSEHLYTTDANEVDVLKRGDWNYEGVAWVAPKKSDSPVWRLYSPGLGDHHYTKDANEVAALTSKYGWTNEGKKWYSDDLKTTPIYRQYNSRLRVGQHHYTADYNEYTVNNARNGWKGEGIAWHALKPGWAAGAKRVSAAAPTITDRSGEASDTVTIPNSSTVIYYLNGKKVSAGTYPITNYVKGADNWRRASVEIIARSVFGYDLNGVYKWNQIVIGNNVAPKPTPKPTTPAPTPTSAKPTSAKPSTPSAAPTSAKPTTPAKKNVKVVKPTFTQKDGKADTITIPNVTGVQYTIKGDKKTQAVKPGTYKVSDFSAYPGNSASIKVSLKADSGYQLLSAEGSPIASMSYTQGFSGAALNPTSQPTTAKPTTPAPTPTSAKPTSTKPTTTAPTTPAKKNVKPKAPTYADKDGKANDTVTIPSVAGLVYKISGDKKTQTVSAGTYKVSSFSSYPKDTAAIKVIATAADGYQLLNDDGKSIANKTYSKNFDGKTSVTATAPTFADKSGKANDTFTVPSKTGVVYKVGGKTLAAGKYKVSDYATYTNHKATVTVTAQAASGYSLSGTSSWSKTFSDLVDVTAKNPEVTNEGIEIPNVTGVQYRVNGKNVTSGSTYKPKDSDYVNGKATLKVSVAAKDGYRLTNPTIQWEATYTKPTSTPTPTPSASSSASPSTTPTASPSASPTPTSTPTPTPTSTATATPTLKSVTVKAPTFTHKDGKADTVTIPSVAGLVYKISGDKKTQTVSAGTYKVSDFSAYPDHSADIKVTVTPKSGYQMLNADGKVITTKTYLATFDGTTSVTATKPTFTDKSGKANDTFTIPNVLGVVYYVDGQRLTPKTYTVSELATYTNHKATVTVTAQATDGYSLSGTSSWPKTFSDLTEVTATKPEVSNNGIKIPNITGVQYRVNGNNVTSGSTYKPADSDYVNGVAEITITAQAKDGYVLTNPNAQWTATFTKPAPTPTPSSTPSASPTPSSTPSASPSASPSTSPSSTPSPTPTVTTVTATAPTFTDKGGEDNDTVGIPNVAGVQYKINGKAVSAGTHKVSDCATYVTADNGQRSAKVTVTATAKTGYALSGTSTWEKNPFWGNAATATPVEPTWNDRAGEGNDTYTIPTVQGVKYTVNGQTVTGTITVPASAYTTVNGQRQATVTVTAEKSGGVWNVTTQTYTHTFSGTQIQTVTPAAPTFTEGAGNNDSYTIPSTPGVNYYVNGASTPATAGPHSVGPYTSNGKLKARTARVSIEARPASDLYTLTGTTQWSNDFTGLIETASQQPPYDADYVNGVAKTIITIPNIEGVQYSIDGNDVDPGTHYEAYGATYIVRAKAKSGYVLTSTTNYWEIVTGGGASSTVVFPDAPTFSDQVGKDNDTVTIPAVSGIYYTINGQRVSAGTHNVKDYATYTNHIAEVTVQAVAESGYAISGTYGWWQQFLDTDYTGGGGSGGYDPSAVIVDTNANQPTNWKSGFRGYYNLPEIEGIQWQVDGVDAEPGEYMVRWLDMPKTVTVKAVAKPGYQIKSGSNYMWIFTFTR